MTPPNRPPRMARTPRPGPTIEADALIARALGVGRWREIGGKPTFVYSTPPDPAALIRCLDLLMGPPRGRG